MTRLCAMCVDVVVAGRTRGHHNNDNVLSWLHHHRHHRIRSLSTLYDCFWSCYRLHWPYSINFLIEIAWPLSNYATISNMLKGSGMAELAEEVKMSRPEEERQKGREKYQILDKIPPTDREMGQID